MTFLSRSGLARGATALLAITTARCAGGGGPADETSEDMALAAARPMLERALPFEEARGGAIRLRTSKDASRWSGERLIAELPPSASAPMKLSIDRDPATRIGIRRLGAQDAAARREGSVVRYDSAAPGLDAIVLAEEGRIEELFVVHDARADVGYELDLPAGWSVRPPAGTGESSSVRLLDASGAVRLSVLAERAWDGTGRSMPVRVTAEGARIRFAVDGRYVAPLVIDPAWTTALAPIRIRAGHTGTLLGNGRILYAGGGSAPKTTEILDPYAGKVEAGPPMSAARTGHTATMLRTGKVLIAGGGSETAELFDPATRTFTATGSMAKSRKGHGAVRLRSGKVLVAGPAAEPSAEIYDPATGTWTATAARKTAGFGSMVTLATGKVLLLADGDQTDGDPDIEVFDEGAGTWTTPSPLLIAGYGTEAATLRRDGTVALEGFDGCISIGGPATCFSHVDLFDPAASSGKGQMTPGPAFDTGRGGAGAVLLPSGEVLYAGGMDDRVVKSAEKFVGTGPSKLSADGILAAGHASPVTTLLPGGDVVVFGGSQAAIDRRITTPTWYQGSPLATGREEHAAARLHDGDVLASGGTTQAEGTTASAELFDSEARSFSSAGNMTVPRKGHLMTTLRSGKVLVTGGFRTDSGVVLHASAELYDPSAAAGSRFKATGSMTMPRTDHTQTILPSGEVLVTGGCVELKSDSTCNEVTDSAELYDPATGKFTAVGKMTEARRAHGAVLLPTGKVLIVGNGNGSAELYDPTTKTFAATTAPGAARDGRSAVLLASGKVLLSSGGATGGITSSTLASELYDPVAESWTFTSDNAEANAASRWGVLPDGRAVLVGGHYALDGTVGSSYVFDPLAASIGAFTRIGVSASTSVYLHTVTLTGSGELLSLGGNVCYGACVSFPSNVAALTNDGAPVAARPTLTDVPASVVAGTKVTIKGTGFEFRPEGSTGNQLGSPTNHPVAFWVSDTNDGVIPSMLLDFTDTSATWLVPTTALYGHGMLFLSSGGILSHGRSVTIVPAEVATGCTFDAECTTGFCVDGVCCDRRCDGLCEGCSAARKKQPGTDGVCGAVPPGEDSANRCFLEQGATCTDAFQCRTGFCAQGVCCDASCTGACQACDQKTSLGRCEPIADGSCAVTCDGDHTLTQVGSPDFDCAPFKCEGARCKETCSSARDCVAPAVCSLDGKCVPPIEPTSADDSVCGCRVVGGRRGAPDRLLGAGVAIVALSFAFARARKRGTRRSVS